MKTKARILSTFLAAAMVIGNAVPAFAAPAADEYHIELEQVGEFTKEGLRLSYNSFLEESGDHEYYVYDYNGNKVFSEAVSSVDYLDKGVYQYTKAGAADVNSKALANNDGKELIPFEYAYYAWPGYSSSPNSRFILAYYGTEETDDTEDYLFYVDDYGVSFGSPSIGDTLYKGYVKVYDIQEEKFVGDLQFEHVDKYDTVRAVGSSIVVKNEDETHTLYDADGKKLLDLGSRVETTATAIIESSETNSGCRVYDENGKELFKSGENLYAVSGTSGYLYSQDYSSNTYTILDQTGKELFTCETSYIYQEDMDIFQVAGDDDTKIILDRKGKELGRTEGDMYYIGYGRYALQTGVNTVTLTGPSGTIVEEAKEETSGMLYSKDGSIVNFNDGTGYLTYDSDLSYSGYMGVIYVQDYSNDTNELYDAFTGKKLLGDGFYSASNVGDYLVVEYHDGPDYTYKTFKVNIVEGK